MARPLETGIDYFPLNVDFDYDDKFQIILGKFSAEGIAILIVLMCKIYKNGYYYEWTEKEQLLHSRRVNVNINTIIDCVNESIKHGIFDKNLYDKYQILTSNGIQKRYFEAIKRRKEIMIIKEFIINDNINLISSSINVNINSLNDDINVNIKAQSKVKESKVKESKVYKDDFDNPKKEKLISDYQIEKFNQFWELYDKKVEREKTQKLFNKLTEPEIEKCLVHVPEYVKSQPDKQYRKNPTTYLNNKCFNDEIIKGGFNAKAKYDINAEQVNGGAGTHRIEDYNELITEFS